MFDTIRKQAYSLIGQEDFQPKTWYEELEEQCCSHCPSMSFEYRLMCCIFCIVLGFLISMGSTFRLMKLLAGNPYPFAVLYSIGNILGISSTCFLFGPVAQFKKMFAPTRAIASICYLLFMFLTLLLAFYPNYIPGRIFLIVVFVFCQFLSLVWYTLSYIPFARNIAISCLSKTCCCNESSSLLVV